MSVARGIDPRGPQFTAALTAATLVAALATLPGSVGVAILAVQAVLFLAGAVLGVQNTPVAWVFRAAVRPLLAAPDHLEDPAPPRFAQTVGLTFAAVALVSFLLGVDAVGFVAVGFALAAALLNAVFGFCLGCELFLIIRRSTTSAAPAAAST